MENGNVYIIVNGDYGYEHIVSVWTNFDNAQQEAEKLNKCAEDQGRFSDYRILDEVGIPLNCSLVEEDFSSSNRREVYHKNGDFPLVSKWR